MESLRKLVLCFGISGLLSAPALAQDFSGEWTIDLRTPQQKQEKVECGEASFSLQQKGDQISGHHQFYTVGCGRMNEGEAESVQGIAVGNTAVLAVTSNRTGTIVLGKAVLKGESLTWETRKELYPGVPGDSPLILAKGILKRAKGDGQR